MYLKNFFDIWSQEYTYTHIQSRMGRDGGISSTCWFTPNHNRAGLVRCQELHPSFLHGWHIPLLSRVHKHGVGGWTGSGTTRIQTHCLIWDAGVTGNRWLNLLQHNTGPLCVLLPILVQHIWFFPTLFERFIMNMMVMGLAYSLYREGLINHSADSEELTITWWSMSLTGPFFSETLANHYNTFFQKTFRIRYW